MHMGHSEFAHAEKTVSVTFHLDDPHALTDTDQAVWELKAAKGQPLLEVAVHAASCCGGLGGQREPRWRFRLSLGFPSWPQAAMASRPMVRRRLVRSPVLRASSQNAITSDSVGAGHGESRMGL